MKLCISNYTVNVNRMGSIFNHLPPFNPLPNPESGCKRKHRIHAAIDGRTATGGFVCIRTLLCRGRRRGLGQTGPDKCHTTEENHGEQEGL